MKITQRERDEAIRTMKPLPANWTPKPDTLCDVNGSRVQSAQSVHGREKWHADIAPASPVKAKLKVSRR